ncbi:MAG: DNA methyltransferase, partial [Candidatus Nitrosopolaris sp.]
LERIIGQFSTARHLVADFFCGSGTTLAVAQKLGRNWIGCDCSPTAIQVSQRRLEHSDFSLIRSKS